MKKDPTAARLCSKLGCSACKHQQIEDEFLTEHSRFWCGKKKVSFGAEDRAHQACPHWTFSGNNDLIKAIEQPDLPGGEG